MNADLVLDAALKGGAVWIAQAFVLPALVALVASVVPARRTDPTRHAGSFRDALDTSPPTARRALALAVVWARAFYATRRGFRRVGTLLSFPTVLAKLCCYRFLPRHVVVDDACDEGVALLTLRLAKDGSWWLADLAAWPLGRRLSERLVGRVLAAADASGRTIHLCSANRALADGYYARWGFRLDSHAEGAAPLVMSRAPRRLEN